MLDVHYHEDARITDVSPLAELLYIRCLCACKRLMNDGELSNTQINRIGADLCCAQYDIEGVGELTAELLNVGLLEGDKDAWMTVRSWADWNKPSEEIEAISAARAAAGRRGGLKSAEQRSKTEANGEAKRSNVLKQNEASRDLLGNPEVEVEVEKEVDVPSRNKPKTGPPKTFEVTSRLKEWANKNEIRVDLEVQTQLFLDGARANGRKYIDWDSAWMTWMRNRSIWDKEKETKNQSTSSQGQGRVQRTHREQMLGDVNGYRLAGLHERADELQAEIDAGVYGD